MSFCILIDFDDSFTYNIAGELYLQQIPVEVVHFSRIQKEDRAIRKLLIADKSGKVVIYGPGPGHPNDYKSFAPTMLKIASMPDLFQMGICLGHQLFWNLLLAAKVIKSKRPLHGQAVPLVIPNWPKYFDREEMGKKVLVQRYNSLAISLPVHTARIKVKPVPRFVFSGGECLMGSWQNAITYQFHPESVGTNRSNIFFGVIKRIFYNKRNQEH